MRRRFGTVESRPDRRDAFYVRWHWKGVRYRRYGGMTAAVAQKRLATLQVLIEKGVALDRAMAEVFGGVHGSTLTFRAAIEPFLAYAANRRTASTHLSLRQVLAVVSRAKWAGSPLGEIRPRDIQSWATERVKGGASGATLNRNLNAISGVYRWAIRSGHVEDNPVRRVERFSERGRARETYLTADEARALLDACPPGIRDVVLTALHTGMRRGELLAIRWGRVDLGRREILIEAATEKAGRGRVVPMTDALHERMAALRREYPRVLAGDDPVFVLPDGREITTKIVRAGFEGAVKRCLGIPLEKRTKVTFHTLRHTAASLMVAEGVPLFDVAKILGHSTIAVTMRYAHFAPEAGRAGIEKLGTALQRGAVGLAPDAGSGGAARSRVSESAAKYTTHHTRRMDHGPRGGPRQTRVLRNPLRRLG